MTLGATTDENGKKIYQFNVTEEEMNSMLDKSEKETTLNIITGNSEYDAIHFELAVKKAVKRYPEDLRKKKSKKSLTKS